MRRCAPDVIIATRRRPDLIVLSDIVVPEPTVVTELLGSRIPHLVGYAHEGTAVVGGRWYGQDAPAACAVPNCTGRRWTRRGRNWPPSSSE